MPKAEKKKTRKALVGRDIPSHAAKLERVRRVGERKTKLKGKTFESLSQKDKDALLKTLAIRAGLLEDSEDQD